MRALGRWLVWGCCLASVLAPVLAEPISAQRRGELRHLILHDCGSCHGMRLTGGLGPALTPDALRERPPETITATVLHGRPGSAMPGWRSILSDAEAKWITDALQQGINNAR